MPPNGWRYRLVGGTRERCFDGTNFKPHKLPENAATPIMAPLLSEGRDRVHAVLGSFLNVSIQIKMQPSHFMAQ
jgi:hypothetical protein